MKDQLRKFQSVVEDLVKSFGDEKAEEVEGSNTVEMTVEEFLAYVTGQVEAAIKDEEEVKKSRLESLFANVEIVKEFIGSPKVPGGILSVVMFQDPAQQKTDLKVINPQNAPMGQDLSSSNGIQPAVNGAGSVSGDKMPPLSAGGTGFETPANASFAKAIEDLSSAISDLVGANNEWKKETDKVEKSEVMVETPKGKKLDEIPFWPLDMNSPFGRGEVEEISEPNWGFDYGKSHAE